MKRGQSRQDTLLEIMSVNLKSSFLYPVRFGSPAIVLRHMLPAVSEVFACEISDDAVQLLFKNNQSSMPRMVLRDIALVEEGEVAFDYVSGETRSGTRSSHRPVHLWISLPSKLASQQQSLEPRRGKHGRGSGLAGDTSGHGICPSTDHLYPGECRRTDEEAWRRQQRLCPDLGRRTDQAGGCQTTISLARSWVAHRCILAATHAAPMPYELRRGVRL